MPSIAQQLRADRLRRERRRRATVGMVLAASAALLGTRLLAGASTDLAGATSTAPTTAALAPTSSSPPSGLHPDLVDAFERARADAADDGHRLTITSGFRTADEQEDLLDAEVAKRGSLVEALWWVFPPDRSMHVQGLAIDVGDGPAADWLEQEGHRYGLCRTLDWEWWHFEWRRQWETSRSCPAPAATPDAAPGP